MLLKEKNEIVVWLDKYNIENYTLRPDDTYGYVVDVAGNVELSRQKIIELSVKFGTVSGDFDCSYNFLTSLEGSPLEIGDSFYSDNNQLTSLKGCPQIVGKVFYCSHNELTSLEAMPESVGGGFYCHDNLDLGELQDITDFNTIEKILVTSRLAEKLEYELNIKDNKKKIKL